MEKGFHIRFRKGAWEVYTTKRPVRKYIGRFPTKLMAAHAAIKFCPKNITNCGQVWEDLLKWATVTVTFD